MKRILLIVFISCSIISCKKDNALESEIAKIDTDIRLERFDKLFSEADAKSLPKLIKAYPFMFSEKYPDSFWLAKKQDTLQIQVFNEVAKMFANADDIEEEIESLFNHLKYFIPEFRTPRVITVTNDVDYRNRVIVTDTIDIIALDSYLGTDHEFYGAIQNFIKIQLKKEQIVVDLAEEYAKKFTYQPKRKSLLDEMVYFGKLLYFKDAVIPFKTDAAKIGYSEGEIDWARSNESYIWRYFVERELLFSTDSKLPGRFINPAPFSKFFLEEIDTDSPGRLGQYIGWQIVRAYMNENDVSLKEMLNKTAEDIFNNSKFKPRK